MANRRSTAVSLCLGLVFVNLVRALGSFECEDLPIDACAYSVSSTGTRCVLEKYQGKDGIMLYECQSSMTMAERQEEWIESDECIELCGLERICVGLSTDLLKESRVTKMLCSSECLNNCPNLVDLYTSFAADEGMYLPQLCKAQAMKRIIADPVKKATNEENLRFTLSKLSSDGTMAPGTSPTSQRSAGTTPGSGSPTAPDYGGYGGSPETLSGGGDSIVPTSPGRGVYSPPPSERLSIPAILKVHGAHAPATRVSSIISMRPFLFASSPTPSPSAQSTAVVATPAGSLPGYEEIF